MQQSCPKNELFTSDALITELLVYRTYIFVEACTNQVEKQGEYPDCMRRSGPLPFSNNAAPVTLRYYLMTWQCASAQSLTLPAYRRAAAAPLSACGSPSFGIIRFAHIGTRLAAITAFVAQRGCWSLVW